ncbi:hypothetical protein EX30DRAFT_342277 [Ascodesmis nigricans]|uniref:Integral membrane protein n=1 Tax=Ascodesmis nigricans TaxID=341454 RepID=A0A4S2MT46_9PEZI|nr:hypothetical protein EX30DRAFT_342277 [Ascodesmis nigricans]
MVLASELRLTPPPGYTTPPFPSLYNPHPSSTSQPKFLYHTSDAIRFTLLWTLIVYAGFHLASGVYGLILRPSRVGAAGFAVIFTLVGGIEAALAGSVVGVLLAAVYSAGYFEMSTWIPLVWAVINVLVLVLSSFSLQGGL